jgi:hypothetical protein
MTKMYNPANWYWTVGGDTTRAYSSAAGDYVLAANATFVTWKADGTQPTPIDTEVNLGGVLASYYFGVPRPIAANVLDAYQQWQADDEFSKKLSKLLFNMLNRIQVLEGKPVLTAAQAKAAVKAMM